MDGDEQLSHDGDEGLDGFLASGDQMQGEGFEVGLPAASDQSGHVEGRAQVLVAGDPEVRRRVQVAGSRRPVVEAR